MAPYKNWGTALLAVWFVTFFANWAVYGSDPINLVLLELYATFTLLVAWGSWSLFVRFRRPHEAKAPHSDQPPAHLLVIAGFVALWYGFSAVSQVMVPSADFDRHLWVDAATACGLLGGIVGAVLLAVRSRHALLAFGASFGGVLVTTLYRSRTTLRPDASVTDMFLFAIVSVVLPVALALFIYVWRMRARIPTLDFNGPNVRFTPTADIPLSTHNGNSLFGEIRQGFDHRGIVGLNPREPLTVLR